VDRCYKKISRRTLRSVSVALLPPSVVTEFWFCRNDIAFRPVLAQGNGVVSEDWDLKSGWPDMLRNCPSGSGRRGS
jgi:hypothetical protein